MGICIVGHFGGNKAFNDGQTVKTITTYNALRDVGITDIDKIDTYYIKRNPFRFLFLLTRGLLRDQKFILLLSINGRRVLFPVFYYASKLLGKEIYHYAIGGRLADEASQNAKIKKYISSFSGWNIKLAPAFSQSLESLSKSLGYLSKSSVGPNCIGFTNILTTTLSLSFTAFFIKLSCPSCK